VGGAGLFATGAELLAGSLAGPVAPALEGGAVKADLGEDRVHGLDVEALTAVGAAEDGGLALGEPEGLDHSGRLGCQCLQGLQ